MLYFAEGGANNNFDNLHLEQIINEILDSIGERNRVLVIPPDFTRYHSGSGIITQFIYKYYGENLKAILPALGTHFPMTEEEISKMYGDIPRKLFVKHNWRNDITTLGLVPGDFLSEVSEGKVNYDWPAQVNKLLVEGEFDLILSVGQVVPHEVIGMANHNKNIFVGTGGSEGINKSHFLGAAYGMERIMG
ncbi:MAG: lactate racemase domain-containing protein, partial [Bacteroidales bacterium]